MCKLGVVRHIIVRYTSQQNGVEKLMNMIVLKRFLCMLSNVDFPKQFLAEAINIACYFINKSPSTTINCKTLEVIWPGFTTSYSILHVFGCQLYPHVNEGKLEP